MPARKGSKSKTKRRRKARGFNIKTALFAYANLAVATRAITNVGPVQFFTEGYLGDTSLAHMGGHMNKITMKEIFAGGQLGPQFGMQGEYSGVGVIPSSASGYVSLGQTAMDNIKQNAIPAVGALIGLKAAEVLITKLGVARNFNTVARSVGMGDVVRA